MPPISPHTCCSLRYWVDVRGDSIVATCSEVSGWSWRSSKIQQDCGKAVETSWRFGVGKSYSFLSSAVSVIEYPDRYHLLYIYVYTYTVYIYIYLVPSNLVVDFSLPNLLGHHFMALLSMPDGPPLETHPPWRKFANFQESFKCGTGWSLRSHPTTGGIRHLSRQPMVVVVDLRLIISSTFFWVDFPCFLFDIMMACGLNGDFCDCKCSFEKRMVLCCELKLN